MISLAIGLVAAGWIASADMPRDDHIGYMLRLTARGAFAFFLLAYLARPMVRLFDVGRPLVRYRRQLGLGMAFIHTVHFGYVATFLSIASEPLDWIVLVFGGGAFVTMWLMAATSNNASVRRLGIWWRRLHTFGMHYLWLIFMQTFAPRAIEGEPLYVAIVSVGLIAAVLRGLAWWRQRRRAGALTA